MKAKKLRRLVDAEIARRQALAPIMFRNLTIDFEKRLVTLSGRGTYATDLAQLVIPILTTERPIVEGGWRPDSII